MTNEFLRHTISIIEYRSENLAANSKVVFGVFNLGKGSRFNVESSTL